MYPRVLFFFFNFASNSIDLISPSLNKYSINQLLSYCGSEWIVLFKSSFFFFIRVKNGFLRHILYVSIAKPLH